MIEDWEHNPDVRTDYIALQELHKRFNKQTGQLTPCSAVSYFKDEVRLFRLMDGHRRKKLALAASMHMLEVIHYPDVGITGEKFGKLFDIFNGGTRIVNTRERTGLALDGERAAAGAAGMKYADIATQNLNEEGLVAFRQANQPNAALSQARTAYKELAARGLVAQNAAAKKGFVSRCLIWQVKHDQQRKLIGAIKASHLAAGRGSPTKATRILKKLLEYVEDNAAVPESEHDFDVS